MNHSTGHARCGGRFRSSAPRHCFACKAVVAAAAGKDLYPYTGCENGARDPTPKEEAAVERFEIRYIVRERVWADGDDS